MENSYWFSKISKEEQEAFKNELHNNAMDYILTKESSSFYDFISKYIVWYDSKKGLNYWIEIASRDIK